MAAPIGKTNRSAFITSQKTKTDNYEIRQQETRPLGYIFHSQIPNAYLHLSLHKNVPNVAVIFSLLLGASVYSNSLGISK